MCGVPATDDDGAVRADRGGVDERSARGQLKGPEDLGDAGPWDDGLFLVRDRLGGEHSVIPALVAAVSRWVRCPRRILRARLQWT
jgi:hypothetical protein